MPCCDDSYFHAYSFFFPFNFFLESLVQQMEDGTALLPSRWSRSWLPESPLYHADDYDDLFDECKLPDFGSPSVMFRLTFTSKFSHGVSISYMLPGSTTGMCCWPRNCQNCAPSPRHCLRHVSHSRRPCRRLEEKPSLIILASRSEKPAFVPLLPFPPPVILPLNRFHVRATC